MIKNIFVILFFLSSWGLHAQNLHAILVADTDNESTGAGHAHNLKVMKQEVANICENTLLRPQAYVIEGNRLTVSALLAVINGLKCSKQDVILFYFSGNEHIGRSRNSQQASLQLKDGALAVSEINEMFALYEPRLSIMITDLCNTTTEKEPDFTEKLGLSKDRYIALFLRSKGKLSLSNHVAREQVDVSTSSKGSIFTNSLIAAIQNGSDSASWKEVLQEARYESIVKSRGSQNPQLAEETQSTNTPIIVPPTRQETTNKVILNEELSKSTTQPQKQTNQTPEEVQNNTTLPLGEWAEEGLKKVNFFQENITQLTTTNRENAKNRTDLTANIMGLFADNMRIIESADLNQNVSSHSLRKYLGTLYSTTDKQNVSIAWYKPAQITDFVRQTNKVYKAQVHVFQEFRQTKPTGELIYGDRVEKIVDLWAKMEKENGVWVWKLTLGNIGVVKGTVQGIPK